MLSCRDKRNSRGNGVRICFLRSPCGWLSIGLCTVARPRRTDGTVCAGTVPGLVKKCVTFNPEIKRRT